MCRLLAWVTSEPSPLAHALGHVELAGFKALSLQHCDGWGMARWAAPPHSGERAPLVDRSTAPASGDPRFDELTAGASADAGIVHLRWATPGLAVAPANTHPFSHGGLAFAHNGAIHPQHRLDEIIPAGWAAEVTGTTDSERYFMAIAQRLREGEPMLSAVAGVVRMLWDDFVPTSLNAMLLGEDALYVVSAHDSSRVPSRNASSGGADSSQEPDRAFYDLRYRVRDDSVVVASSGFQQSDEEAWRPVPNHALVRIERGTLAVTVLPLAA